jgi:hypothetical protein
MKIRGAAALAWIGAIVAACGLAGACSLAVGLDDITIAGKGGSGGSGTIACKSQADCDDHNPCTVDACGADGTCASTPLGEGKQPAQTAGDCKTVTCDHGAPTEQADPTDVPDDHEDCTVDACDGTAPSHTPKPDGTLCEKAGSGGSCVNGTCTVNCTMDSQCPDPGPCSTATCDTTLGVCVEHPLADGTLTPNAVDPVGDCHTHVCVTGVEVVKVDDTDLPKTATDCDVEVCTNGVASNPPRPLDAACSTYLGNQSGFCDGAMPSPSCVQCVLDTECPGVTDDCQHPVCVASACTTAFTPAGTPTMTNPPQMAGDCGRIECDGNGGSASVLDTTDPTSDGNACTTDTCVAMNVTTHVDVSDGTHCGVGGMLACVGGMCAGCTMSTQCIAASCVGTVLMKAQTCNGLGMCLASAPQDCAPYLCSAGANACTSTCAADNGCSQGGVGNYCTAGGTCQPKLPQGSACLAGDHQCQSGHCVDGVCCNSVCTGTCMACSAAKTGGANGTCTAVTTGTDPDAECTDAGSSSCGTTGLCGNGACALYAAGTQCAMATCVGTTLTKARTCNGTGTCVTPNPSTLACAPYLCTGTACTTTCTIDGDCASGSYCSAGACLAKQANGTACSATNQCVTGFCVDGFCCNSVCSGACQACSAALKQSGLNNGTCGSAKNAQPDPHGMCAITMAASCGTDGKCSGGACEDWPTLTVCQAATCSGSQLTQPKTCNGAGSCSQGGNTVACGNGLVCDPTTKACYLSCGLGGAADDSKCVTGDYCDGSAGACKPKAPSGGACSGGNQCASGLCGGSVCCTAVCPDQGAMSCGTNGACQSGTGACLDYPSGTMCSATTCAGGILSMSTSCDGMGSCSVGSSTPCPNGLGCTASGTMCRIVCGTNDANCQSGYYCDGVGAGACQPLLPMGAFCTQSHQCQSTFCFGNMCF